MASGGSVVSVAASTSAAAAGGSVINVSSLVAQLVAADRAPKDAQVATQTSTVTTKISAVGALKGALGTFQSALASLNTPESFAAVAATSSNANVFTATASPGAPLGSYSVAVAALASAQQLLSGPFAGGAGATIGTGTLSLTLGADSFSVVVDASNNTVAGLATAINDAPGNPGITAAVIQGSDGAHLLLSSSKTGAANTLQVAETDAGAALGALTYAPGNTANYTENAAAQDARFSIAGVAYTSAGNTVTDALSGVTLTLTGTTAAGSGASLSVAANTSLVGANIQNFVGAYNALHGVMAQLGAYDAASGSAGPMLGDPLLTGVENQVRHALQSLVGTSAYNSLASVGITTQKDGTLQADSTRLSSALSSHFADVSQLFSGTGGVVAQLDAEVTTALASGGPIDSRSQTLLKQNKGLSDQSAAIDRETQALTASLTQQYSALNVLLSTLQTTSAYLTQAINSLPTMQGKSNG